MPLSKISFREKRIDRRIAAYQSDLIATHYAEVENMYRQTRGWRHEIGRASCRERVCGLV